MHAVRYDCVVLAIPPNRPLLKYDNPSWSQRINATRQIKQAVVCGASCWECTSIFGATSCIIDFSSFIVFGAALL